nr:MAG TPA: hypothetical protein [Bacteriophage sp.]
MSPFAPPFPVLFIGHVILYHVTTKYSQSN